MSQRFSSEPLSSNEEISVLLIEGAPSDAHRFEEMLHESSWDATVRRVQGLAQGLAALREEASDVVVVDVNPLDQDGTTAIANCASVAPQVPIVALTSSEALPSARSLEEAGGAEYLRKAHLTPALIGKTLRWVRERTQMRKKIRQRDAWFRSMTENLSAGIFRAGPTGRIEYANEAFAALFGYDRREEMHGTDFATLYADSVQQGRMVATEGAERVELTFRRPGGSTFTGLLNVTPAHGPNGKLQHFNGVLVDIDERKERERKLRVLSEAVQQAKEAVLITDGAPLDEPGPRIVYVNEAFEEMTGYSEEEILGETPRILQGPKTERDVLDSLREALEKGEKWQGETVNYRKDGTPYHLQWNLAPVRNEGGDIEYWVSVQRDVTDRRRREETLRKQKSLLEQTQRLAGAWEVDLQTGKASGTEKLYRILDVEARSEITTENVFQCFTPKARPQLREAFERCVKEEEPYDLELPIITAEENRRWVRTVGAPAEKEDGEITKVAGAFQDITERKETERQLREREARLRGLANSIPGVVYQFFARPDGTYGFHFVGDRAKDLLGISADPEGFFGRLGRQVPTSYQEKLLDLIGTAVEEAESWSFEIPFKKPSGKQLWLYSAATPERVGDELTFNGVLLDITERRHLERKVIAMSDEERRRIGEDLHDLLASRLAGTAMMARSSAHFLERGDDISADRLHEVADGIEKASKEARSLSRSLMPLEIQDGGLPEGLRSLADRQENISGVVCSFEAGGRVDLSEDVAAHLYRMGAEAVHNALRHADPGRVEIRLQPKEDHLILSVKDDGKGIPEEMDPSEVHGLQLMRYRSDLIGARLDIKPLEEGGTLVRCSLPLENVSPESTDS